MRTPDRSTGDSRRRPDAGRQADETRATANIASRLRDRGLEITGREDGEELTDLLSAVEDFEGAVSRRGGDNMVNRLGSSEPEDEAFVLPVRNSDESLRRYTDRVRAAAEGLRGG